MLIFARVYIIPDSYLLETEISQNNYLITFHLVIRLAGHQNTSGQFSKFPSYKP